MKIVHLLGWYFPDSVGGTEVYVEGLCRRLSIAGHDVLVAAPFVGESAPAPYWHDGVLVFRYPIPGDPTRDEAYGRVTVRGASQLHAWLAQEQPALLHVHSFTTGVGLPEIRAARNLGIRVIATCHLPGLGYMCRTGELMQWGRSACDGVVDSKKCSACNLTRLGMPQSLARLCTALPGDVSRMLSGLPGRAGTTLGMRASVLEYQSLQRELFELVDRFVVLNDTAREMLIANGSPASKLTLNRLGLSHTEVRRKPAPEQQPTSRPVRFGFVGRLHASKGLVELVRAACQVPQQTPFVLEIRGPQHDEQARRLVAELRAIAAGDARVVFGPAVASPDVPRVLASYDVLLCPSTWFENGPTIALEANAVGTPVIASRVGNLAEIVVDDVNGRLLPAGDVPAWSQVIAHTAADPERTIDHWRRHIVPPRTMDDIARDYLSLYAA
jgi:glycosyltransferase involved in cell wall biosynthesis